MHEAAREQALIWEIAADVIDELTQEEGTLKELLDLRFKEKGLKVPPDEQLVFEVARAMIGLAQNRAAAIVSQGLPGKQEGA